ncbi:conserved hypothetical protein [Candidatus Methylobacter favarea]|uniref:Ice-binding protein C-terminal domain-containing protein n=1 Tax=Candidatus Methylobacter favarea TaxID=2707345 RepID=A0A8S0XIA1_9GAMM|nr:PEP-CTERM sorting domain-containing protein [Candidatus Methylobacter favarea]CAA9890506.1 conserved hypothetical protein [Candidatus Methylobacter favarea]
MKSPGLDFLKYIIGSSAITISTLSASAQANFLYEYTSNVIPVTSRANVPKPTSDGGSIWYELVESHEVVITALVNSPARLTNGSGLTDDLIFTLTPHQIDYGYFFYNFFPQQDGLTYPYPLPLFPDCEFCPHTDISAVWNIFAVDALGLPSEWDISISQWVMQRGRGHFAEIATSTNLDSFSGYDNLQTPYASSYEGSLANNPGSWTVTQVPEPESWAMLLSGLGIFGFAGRKRLRQ